MHNQPAAACSLIGSSHGLAPTQRASVHCYGIEATRSHLTSHYQANGEWASAASGSLAPEAASQLHMARWMNATLSILQSCFAVPTVVVPASLLQSQEAVPALVGKVVRHLESAGECVSCGGGCAFLVSAQFTSHPFPCCILSACFWIVVQIIVQTSSITSATLLNTSCLACLRSAASPLLNLPLCHSTSTSHGL